MVSHLKPSPPISGTSRTAAQAAASRRNGARSRGPITPKGKAKARFNAMRHKLYAQELEAFLTDEEDQKAFRRLVEDLNAEFRPETPREELDVNLLACDFWQLRHYEGVSAATWGTFTSSVPHVDGARVERLGHAMKHCKAALENLMPGKPVTGSIDGAEDLAWAVRETGFEPGKPLSGIDLSQAAAWWKDVEVGPGDPSSSDWRTVLERFAAHGQQILDAWKRGAERYGEEKREYHTQALASLDRHDLIERQRTRIQRRIERTLKRLPKSRPAFGTGSIVFPDGFAGVVR